MRWSLLAPVGAGLAAVPFMTSRVHAAEVKLDVPVSPPAGKTTKACELPLYGSPEEPEVEYVPEHENKYTEAVTSLRKTIWDTADSMQSTTDKIKNGYNIGKQYGKDLKKNVQEDSGVLKRAGLITVAGLGGVVAGYRGASASLPLLLPNTLHVLQVNLVTGGFLRKATFAGVAMATTAAICYPNQAVEMSNTGWDKVKTQAKELWQSGTGSKQVTESKQNVPMSQKEGKEADKLESPVIEKHRITRMERGGDVKIDTPKEDHGMSNVEDKDMYTTRS